MTMPGSRNPNIHFEPNKNFSSSNPAPIAPELEGLHSKLGKLVVNRLTYRLFRLSGRIARPQSKFEKVRIRMDSSLGRQTIVVEPNDGAVSLTATCL